MNKYEKDLKSISDQIGFTDKRLESLTELVERATPPTAEEVCQALSEYYKCEVFYNKIEKEFEIYDLKNQKTWGKQCRRLYIDDLYNKPHLITMIGRFYEGVNNEHN